MCSYSWRVPATTLGNLKIVASADIGDAGPRDGQAVTYTWRFYYSLPALALWAVLALTFVSFKANRNPQAFLILIPVVVLHLIWSVSKAALSFPSQVAPIFDQVFTTFVIGVTVLWLLAHKIGNRNRFVSLVLALVIMVVLALVGMISYGGGGFSPEMLAALIMVGVLTAALLLGFVLSAYCCRKRFGPVRQSVWLVLWDVVISTAGFVLYLGIMMMSTNIPLEALWQVLIAGVIVGTACYLILLPYLILVFRTEFWWARLYALLHLKSMRQSRASGPTPSELTMEEAPAEVTGS